MRQEQTSDGLLAGLRHLTDQARGGGGEHAVVSALSGLLADLPRVSAVRTWWPDDGANAHAPDVARAFGDADGWRNDGSARAVLPLFADGTVVAVLAVDRADDGSHEWVVQAETLASAASASLTARRALNDARLDVLTEVLTRSAMDAALATEVDRAERFGLPLSVIFMDLDRFKAVNDELGHATGDSVLREVGIALRQASRPQDHVGRPGGDEFVVVAPATDGEAALRLADRLREAASRRASAVIGRHLGCSAGVLERVAGTSASDLLDRADGALRTAKRTGRDRAVFERRSRDRRDPSDGLATAGGQDLEDALDGKRLETHFQPLQRLASGAVVAYEALSRGPGQLRRPDRLLEAAARSGRLVDCDERLRERSFAAAAQAGLPEHTTLLVNIERETLLRMATDESVWPRPDVGFPSMTEITERAMFSHPALLLRSCLRLRELGWGIALDDLGQDPRALALLPLLDPDLVKLDLRLLQDRPPADLAAVNVAVSAHVQRTGAVVVAEGIEHEEHLRRAHALGADVGQGHLLGRPSPTIDRPADAARLPIRRALRPVDDRSPFDALAERHAQRVANRSTLGELQANVERRALGIGATAMLVAAVPAAADDPGAPRRLRHLSRDIGFTALSHPAAATVNPDGVFETRLPVGHPLHGEWIAVVTCPHYSLTLAARPVEGADDEWRYVIDHDVQSGLEVARSVLLSLPLPLSGPPSAA